MQDNSLGILSYSNEWEGVSKFLTGSISQYPLVIYPLVIIADISVPELVSYTTPALDVENPYSELLFFFFCREIPPDLQDRAH